jgi:hypothetical protein
MIKRDGGVVYACMYIFERDKERLNFSSEREVLDKESLLSRRKKETRKERERGIHMSWRYDCR